MGYDFHLTPAGPRLIEEERPHLFAETTVFLGQACVERMAAVVAAVKRVAAQLAWAERVLAWAPAAARHGTAAAGVFMGYDFHLGQSGPQLIEVNTNAGGIFPAWLAGHPGAPVPQRLQARLRATFAAEIQAHSRGALRQPRRVAIIDEAPAQQFLYPEMQLFAELFQAAGVVATVVDPAQLSASADGVRLDGERVDLIYNRNCDFYLETSPLAGLLAAYQAGTVCLTPNPFNYPCWPTSLV